MARAHAAWRSLAGLLFVAAVGGSLAGCGNSTPAEAAEVELLGADAVPKKLLDLDVEAEDASMVKNKKEPFVDAVGLYSLRRDDLLQGVLQVSRFTDEANVDRSAFRRQVVQQIGSTVPQRYRMGDQAIFLTTGRRQAVAIWFKGHDLFVLSTRDEYSQPLALLREALELDL